VLDAIRGHPLTHLLPVVVLTSSAQERDRLQTYSLGANSYIVKPVDFEQFMDAARQIGMYWLMLNAAPPDPEENGHAPAPP
jgi:CheY-like chemotaxis protein